MQTMYTEECHRDALAMMHRIARLARDATQWPGSKKKMLSRRTTAKKCWLRRGADAET